MLLITKEQYLLYYFTLLIKTVIKSKYILNMNRMSANWNVSVTKCKRLFLIISRIILSFVFDIRAELYLEVYNFDFLPKRIKCFYLTKS